MVPEREPLSPVVEVTDETFDSLYAESAAALRDILYLYLEIASDCLPWGDFDRADRGTFDPYRFLAITYRHRYQFRSESDLRLLHEGSAISLIAHLAEIAFLDECSESTFVEDFARGRITYEHPAAHDTLVELARIHHAYVTGRIVDHPLIRSAFDTAFTDPESFLDRLPPLVADVIVPTFERAGRPDPPT